MESWHSYPSIYNVGHRVVESLMGSPVNVEEKVDGSQFSFGVDDGGMLHCRSKGKDIDPAHLTEKMFGSAVETAKALMPRLRPGWTYRGEYLQKPKHNHLPYARVPALNIILFDVNTAEASYLSYPEKRQEAERIGLEVVPLVWQGTGPTLAQFDEWLTQESVLGGPPIEGIVIKPSDYDQFGPDKKVLMAKYVSPVFREEQKKSWRAANPTKGDIVQMLGMRYATEARWRKAIQHCRERGELEGSPRDIGRLLKEIPDDIAAEAEGVMRDALWTHFWPQIRRVAVSGFPEWYKRTLAEQAFTPHET